MVSGTCDKKHQETNYYHTMKHFLKRLLTASVAVSTLVAASATEQKARKASGGTPPAVQARSGQRASTHFTLPGRKQAPTFRIPPLSNRVTQKTPAKAAQASPGRIPGLQGNVLYSNAWSVSSMPFGIYSVPTSDAKTFRLLVPGNFEDYGNFEKDGLYYTSSFENWWGMFIIKHTVWDAATGAQKYSIDGDSPTEIVIDAATDPVSGTIYAITLNSEASGYNLGSMNVGAYKIQSTAIGAFDVNVCALAIDGEGQLYAIAKEVERDGNYEVCTGSKLLKVNKQNGSYEIVGDTGCCPQDMSSATIDPRTGRMFWTVNAPDNSGSLYEVDTTTGAATLVYNFPTCEQVVGLTVQAPAAEEGAPDEAGNLQAIFENGSLSGTVTFDAPTTTYSGDAGSGALSYEVRCNDITAATGSTEYGAHVSADITVDKAGEYEFTVTTSNSAGRSPATQTTVFIGKGTPASPSAVKCLYTDGKINLSWDAVTSSADGGYIDPTAVRYSVRRDNGTIAAEGITTPVFSEEVSEPASLSAYYYEVRAEFDGHYSGYTKSNTVTLGTITLPYSVDFGTSATSFNGYTVIDANQDGKTWSRTSSGARVEYDRTNAMDDWLITPGFKLKEGYCYRIEFEAKIGLSGENERLEVMLGKGAAPELMTISGLAATEITSTTYTRYSFETVCTESSTYYLGFHGISDPFKYYLYVNNISISTGAEAITPGAVSELRAVPDPDGALKADISFKAPTTDQKGEPLSAITRIEIARNDVVIREFASPTPGEELSYTDMPYQAGMTTYSVVAYNAYGAGTRESVTIFVGYDIPAAPSGVSIRETDTPGEVCLTWDAVDTDRNGNPIKASAISYGICVPGADGTSWVIKENELKSTTYTFKYLSSAMQQDFARAGVVAFTDAGASTVTAADMIPVGTAYSGFHETASDGSLDYIWASAVTSPLCSVSLYTDSTLEGIPSQDRDNGYIAIYSQNTDDGASISSGKISLAGISEPMLTFYTYGLFDALYGTCKNTVCVDVREAGGSWARLYEKTVGEIAENDCWGRVSVDLKAYAGKTIQLRITSIIHTYTLTLIDNIDIATPVLRDLVAAAIEAPQLSTPGEDYTVSVSVWNNGYVDISDYSVELYADGTKVDTAAGIPVAAESRVSVNFTRTMHALDTESVSYHAVIVYGADEVPDNNVSETMTVWADVSHLPRVSNLSAKACADGSIELNWSDPDISVLPGVVSDDFEDGESFSKLYKDWVFVDGDRSPAGGINNKDVPGLAHGETLMSFFVFDNSPEQFNSTFDTHSGTKFLASFYRADHGQSDEWAISPELSGHMQSISFYARSYDAGTPEIIEIYHSEGSTEPKDFVLLKEAQTLPQEWRRYSALLPAGAKRFAVRSCATDAFILMLDDFSYEVNGEGGSIAIRGYNVYRDGVQLNSEPVEENSYTDSDVSGTYHKYVVTVLYDLGQSAPSNEASADMSGVDGRASAVSISTSAGRILVNGPDDMQVSVAAIDGTALYLGRGSASVAVAPGVYVVKANSLTRKVMVK